MHSSFRALALGAAATLIGGASANAAGLAPGTTRLLDRPTGDLPLPFDGNDYSIASAHRGASSDGRYVVFESDGDALAVGTGGLRTERYVFVRDRTAGTVVNACTSAAGVVGSKGCANASISPNGRYVTFTSASTNLTGQALANTAIFVKDLQTGAISLASRATGVNGAIDGGYPSSPSVADNGSVAFYTYSSGLDPLDTANTHADVYVRTLAGVTTLISKSGGVLGDNDSTDADISGDGTRVAFSSRASNFGSGGSISQIYVATTSGGTPAGRSRIGAAGAFGNGPSNYPSLSQDGQEVAFTTSATNLVGSDTNGASDVILRTETPSASNTPISVVDGSASTLLPFGGESPRINGTGTFVAFQSPDAPGWGAMYRASLRGVAASKTTIVSREAGLAGTIVSGSASSVSDDGNTVIVGTSDLDANGASQLWARTVGTGTNERASRFGSGPETPEAEYGRVLDTSADGRFSVFISQASGLAPGTVSRSHLYLRDERSRTTTQLDRAGGPAGSDVGARVEDARLSDDGNVVVFTAIGAGLLPDAGATDAHAFVWRRSTNALTLEDRAPDGTPKGVDAEGGLDVSADGTKVAFVSESKLVPSVDVNAASDVYVRDLATGALQLASRSDGPNGAVLNDDSDQPLLDADGSVVAFSSDGDGAAGEDLNTTTDAFARDLVAGRTTLVSAVNGGATSDANNRSNVEAISADGNRIAFGSEADTLGDGDTDADHDVHLRELSTKRTLWVSRPLDGSPSTTGAYGRVSISGDGNLVSFESSSSKILPDAKEGSSLYLRDLAAAGTVRLLDPDPSTSMASFGGVLSSNGQCLVFNSNDPSTVSGGYASPDFSHAYLRALGSSCVNDDPIAAPTPTPIAAAKDTIRPLLSAFKSAKRTFARTGKKKGTTLTFTASEAVTVKFEIAALTQGKKQGKRCLAKSKVKGKAKTCAIEGKAKTVSSTKVAAGKRTIAFAGKVGKKTVKAGRYRLILTATDAAGNTTAKRATVDVNIR